MTPANRPLQHLEAGRLGASTLQHVPSRPAVPDLCIASSSLLSVLDPLPMDRLSRHTVAEICSWPATDRHAILAVANRDVLVARQNIAELLLYVDDHAAHLANCASADDDSLTLMSAELLPRLEGGGDQGGPRRGRPAVPDLCIASSSLLSVLDPLPMDRLSRHTVCLWYDIIDVTRLLHMIYVVLLVLHGISGRAFAAI